VHSYGKAGFQHLPCKSNATVRAVEGRTLGGFFVQPFGLGSGSVWGCVLRTASASISRSSSLVIGGLRGVGFHEVMSYIWG
jgi:hypothetical protein